MSDELTIRGGGVAAVSTDRLIEQETGGEALSAELVKLVRQVDRLLGDAVTAAPSELSLNRHLHAARDWMLIAARHSSANAAALRAAATAYGLAERAREWMLRELTGRIGHTAGLIGASLPWIFTPVLPGLLGSLAGVGLGASQRPDEAAAAATRLVEESGLLNSPATVVAVRELVMSADDVLAGALRLPSEPAAALGDRGLDITSVASVAGLIVGGAGLVGIAREGRVLVSRGRSGAASPPRGAAERVGRIPLGRDQLRIERFERAGLPPRFEVYIGGTRDFSVSAGAEAWDLTSNLHAMAGGSPASYRAAAQAMREAGVDARTPVAFTGHSQGALVASRLAASGDYSTSLLLTVGGPVGQVRVPSHVPVLHVAHTDDLVTTVGGAASDPHAVRVERRAVDAGTPGALPAHALTRYRETAELIDARQIPLVDAVFARADEAVAGVGAGRFSLWRGERVTSAADE